MRDHCSKSAEVRVNEYKEQGDPFIEESGLLLCKTCRHVVDHSRKSSLDKHIESKRHDSKKNNPDLVNSEKSTKDWVKKFPENFYEKREVLFCVRCNQALDHTWPSAVKGHRRTCSNASRPKRKAENEDERETKRRHTAARSLESDATKNVDPLAAPSSTNEHPTMSSRSPSDDDLRDSSSNTIEHPTMSSRSPRDDDLRDSSSNTIEHPTMSSRSPRDDDLRDSSSNTIEHPTMSSGSPRDDDSAVPSSVEPVVAATSSTYDEPIVELSSSTNEEPKAASLPSTNDEPMTEWSNIITVDDAIQNGIKNVARKNKQKLLAKYQLIVEEKEKEKHNSIPLDDIYTPLYITEGEIEGTDDEHELCGLEMAFWTQSSHDAIECTDIFEPLSGREKVQLALTKGMAGIGKTICVHKFILGWAKEEVNKHIQFMFVLPFRELNFIEDEITLLDLLKDFHPELNDIDPKACEDIFTHCKVVIIFDGLDESRFPLRFNGKSLSCMAKKAPVDVILTNLIKGNLLPNALLWITSRPAATQQITRDNIKREIMVTHIRGFNDQQKEEFFKKRFINNPDIADKIISEIKRPIMRSFHIMCHIPVFCWIAAKVFEQIVCKNDGEQIPTTHTEMYSHFLRIQTERTNQKYNLRNESDPRKIQAQNDTILKLGKLAFHHLETGKLVFTEEDLQQFAINAKEQSVFDVLITELIREEDCFHDEKVYSFAHLTIQEFLAAIFIFHCFMIQNIREIESLITGRTRQMPSELSLEDFLSRATNKALEKENGCFDIVVSFLHGLSLKANRRRLSCLRQIDIKGSFDKAKENLIKLNTGDISPERCINLIRCLTEMKDFSIQEEAAEYKKGKRGELSLILCSALVQSHLTSTEVLELFDLKEYKTIEEGHRRLVPLVRCSKKAILSGCKLTEKSCKSVKLALQSANSPLTELDLGENDIKDTGAEQIFEGLKSSHCKLKSLRLNRCNLTKLSCEALASALSLNPSHLKKLDLSDNDLGDEGIELISTGLKNQQCTLDTLRLSGCRVGEVGCAVLASALKSNPSHLKVLDLSHNNPGESGKAHLWVLLKDQNSGLKELNFNHCGKPKITAGLQKSPPQPPEREKNPRFSPDLKHSTVLFKQSILEKYTKHQIYETIDLALRKRLALLITNIEFKKKIYNRKGAEKDEENMEKLLKGLGYDVVKYRNLSGQEIHQCIEEFSKRKDLSMTDSVFVVIMSHGEKNNKILGVKHSRKEPDIFRVKDIFKLLNPKNCPTLCDKPKVILIQACRGDEPGGLLVSANMSKDNGDMEEDNMVMVHKEKDFIVFHSTTPGLVSYRHTIKGSPFIQHILKVFNTYACEDHIEELFRKVQQCFKDIKCQMPCRERCTLTKLFYLFPGL